MRGVASNETVSEYIGRFRNSGLTGYSVLVGGGGDCEMTVVLEDKPSPTRTLNSEGCSVKLLFHFFKRAKVFIDGGGQRAGPEHTSNV
jgi:hypothetical protein